MKCIVATVNNCVHAWSDMSVYSALCDQCDVMKCCQCLGITNEIKRLLLFHMAHLLDSRILESRVFLRRERLSNLAHSATWYYNTAVSSEDAPDPADELPVSNVPVRTEIEISCRCSITTKLNKKY